MCFAENVTEFSDLPRNVTLIFIAKVLCTDWAEIEVRQNILLNIYIYIYLSPISFCVSTG